MIYRIYIESRMDKQKPIIEAVRELEHDFVILQGRSYYNKTHVRPCQVIEVHGTQFMLIEPCIKKLKKILGTPHILVTRTNTERTLY